jgi:GNAT superfamily N-acetyltransferase
MTFGWTGAARADLAAISAIAARIHAELPERPEVFEERWRFYPAGCQVLSDRSGRIAGYGLSFPWKLRAIPPLDKLLGRLPEDADCLYVHDVAVLPEARGQRAAQFYIEWARCAAAALHLPNLACVSVYGTYVMWERFGFSTLVSPAIDDQLRSYGGSARYMVAPVAAARAASSLDHEEP